MELRLTEVHAEPDLLTISARRANFVQHRRARRGSRHAKSPRFAEQIKEVFAEAKGNGFDVKTLRKVIARRKKDRARLQEEETLMDLYLSALGEV
jgi:uncharacterized protein (UPF0335 family)